MPFLHKILIIFITLFSFNIIYNIVDGRPINMSSIIPTYEPFESLPTIASCSKTELPIKEYTVLSSWNSCVTTSYDVSLDQIQYVLNNGCRFFDFEIYYLDKKPVVGYSSYESYNYIDSNYIPLIDVCKFIAIQAFTSPTPNSDDPLFIHLRIKAHDHNIFELIANHIMGSGMKNKLFSGNLSSNHKLSDIMGKIVIIVDQSYVPNINKYACIDKCETDILNIINLFSNTNLLQSSKISEMIDKEPTSSKHLKMTSYGTGPYITPNNSHKFKEVISNHHINFLPVKFYNKDDNLKLYTNFFSDNGQTAFVPLSDVR